jgi:hypothetical protein
VKYMEPKFVQVASDRWVSVVHIVSVHRQDGDWVVLDVGRSTHYVDPEYLESLMSVLGLCEQPPNTAEVI